MLAIGTSGSLDQGTTLEPSGWSDRLQQLHATSHQGGNGSGRSRPVGLGGLLGVGFATRSSQHPYLLEPYLLEIEGGTHQVPFAADFLPTAVEEAPESHTHLNLPKRGLRRTFPPTIQFPMSRHVHNPLELAFGQVTLAYADHLTTISGFVMATRAGHRLRALIRSRPVGGMLVSKYENVVVGASKPVLVPIVAEAVQFGGVLARLASSRGGTHRRHASLLARLPKLAADIQAWLLAAIALVEAYLGIIQPTNCPGS